MSQVSQRRISGMGYYVWDGEEDKSEKTRRVQSSETVAVQSEQGEHCFKMHLTPKYFCTNIKLNTYFKNV